MLRLLVFVLWALPALATPFQPSCQTGPLPSGEGISLELTFAEPVLSPVEGGVSIRLPGEGMMGMAGCPDLPIVNRHIRIPATKGVQVEILEEHWVEMGWQAVAPLQERVHTESELPLPWLRDEEVYQSARPWPAEWLRVSDPMLLRETRLVTLTVVPLRWNPVTGELQRLESLSLQVHFSGENELNQPLRDDEGISEDGEGLIYSQQQAEEQFLQMMLGGRYIDAVHPEAGEQGGLDAITWGAPELPLNYLVIAKAAWQNAAAFQQWVAWKRQKGHHVTILGEAEIASWTSNGIRNAIISQYTTSPFPPHYVALIGDTDAAGVPTHTSQYDHYYAAISGSDILADVVVGRISVGNVQHLNTVVNKILSYEQSPDLSSTNWLRRAGWLTGSGHCGVSMSQLSRDFAFQLMQERGYMQVDTAFCANSPSWVANWFNAGVSHYNYRGWWGMEGLSTSTLLAMTNSHTPIAVVFTCGSGDFYDSQAIAYTEAFFRAGNAGQVGGAAAAMGFCTLNTHTAYNNLVDGGFWSAMLDYGVPQVGTCMFRGKQELFNSLPPDDGNISNFSYWANLMGDPGMEMWCGVPDVLRFETLPDTLGTGAQALELRVVDQDSQPVAGVAVCAWFSVTQSALGLTDENGRVTLALPALGQGSLALTASKAFCKPARAGAVLDNTAAMPVVQSLLLTDGNGDGALTPGETATLRFTLANHSASTPLSALDFTLELADAEAAELLATTGALPALAPLDSATVSGDLQLQVSQAWTEGLPVALNLRLSGAGGDFLLRSDLTLSTPALTVLTSGWTGNALYPGQTEDWLVRVSNAGNRTARQLHLDAAFPEGSGLSVVPATFDLDSLVAGEMLNLTVSISAETWLVPGYTAPLIMTWADQSIAASGELRSAVVLGNRVAGDPTGPDAYGYYAFESTDTQWTQSPAFNWVEIAPNAGGTGTVVNLQDNSDEADDSRRVDLPFTFPVYGQPYSSLAVCSNGFVAFGPLAHLQTDFRNHYLPIGMGPEPMLAPMWDDFKLTSDAQVATLYLSDIHVFVIEWYRMRTNSNNRINSFQILLYDPAIYPTPTGDGEIVYQYNLFDDTQSNSQDFPYCTIGLKNQDATIGLTLLNYHQSPTTASAFAAGKAVRISTSIGLTVDPAQLELSAGELAFQLSESAVEAASDSLTLGNLGQAPLIWSAGVVTPLNWPPDSLQAPAARDAGGPDSFGYTWRDSLEPGGPAAGWVSLADGQEVVLEDDDDIFGPIDLPFAFPFYDEIQSQLWVGANGFVSFQEPDASYWQNNVNPGVPHADAPDKALMIWWDDLFPNGDFAGYTRWWTNGADSLVVGWEAAPHFNQSAYGGPFTFQVVLEANGRITFNYGDMAGGDQDSDSGTIAVQYDATTGFSISQMDPSRDNISVEIQPPFWLQLETTAGSVTSGGTGSLVMRARNDVQGLLLPPGDYSATVRLICNDPEQPEQEIPVTLTIGDVGLDDPARPLAFSVGQAVPNPFNPTATFTFTLPEAANVQARLYNVGGQYVGTVYSGPRAAGVNTLRVDGSRLASGVYLLKLEAGAHTAVRKLTLLK